MDVSKQVGDDRAACVGAADVAAVADRVGQVRPVAACGKRRLPPVGQRDGLDSSLPGGAAGRLLQREVAKQSALTPLAELALGRGEG